MEINPVDMTHALKEIAPYYGVFLWAVIIVCIPIVFFTLKHWRMAHREVPDPFVPTSPTYYGNIDPESYPDKKPAKTEKKRWIIPTENIEELLGLSDQEGDLAAYKFWKKIAELFPETQDYACSTDFETDILKPAIVED
jgi:hypothetical protein